jgi:hypothetical protein
MKFQIAAWCYRAGFPREVMHKALLKAYPKLIKGERVVEVEVGGKKWLVGKGKLVCVLPLPFKGWADEYKVVPPIRSKKDLEFLLSL